MWGLDQGRYVFKYPPPNCCYFRQPSKRARATAEKLKKDQARSFLGGGGHRNWRTLDPEQP